MLVQEKFRWCKSLLLFLVHGWEKTAFQGLCVRHSLSFLTTSRHRQAAGRRRPRNQCWSLKPLRSCASMPSINQPIASSMAPASGLDSEHSSSFRQGSPLSMSGSAGGCWIFGTSMFASRHTPRNPVKQGSVFTLAMRLRQVCTCTYLYLVRPCVYSESVHTIFAGTFAETFRWDEGTFRWDA
jgi:hypothetical protein